MRTMRGRNGRIGVVRAAASKYTRPAGLTALVAAAALTASGCDDTPKGSEYAQICVDQKTGLRVDDARCPSTGSSGSFAPMFFQTGYGHHAPAVGYTTRGIRGGTYTIPKSAPGQPNPTVLGKGSVDPKGGTITRGGFGVVSKGGSSGS